METSCFDAVGVDAAVLAGDAATQRMADERDGEQLQVLEQLRHVEDVVDHGVLPAARPLRIAVAAQVGGDDVELLAQFLRHPVPVAAVVPAAVDEHHRRRAGRCPNPRSAASTAASRRRAMSVQ